MSSLAGVLFLHMQLGLLFYWVQCVGGWCVCTRDTWRPFFLHFPLHYGGYSLYAAIANLRVGVGVPNSGYSPCLRSGHSSDWAIPQALEHH